MIARLADYTCAAGLLLLFGLKLFAPDFGADGLIVLVGVLELSLGVSFVVRRTPKSSALGLTTLGVAFCAWALFRGAELVGGEACGCYGPYRLDYLTHLGVATLVMCAGGIQLLLVTSNQKAQAQPST